LGGTGSKTAESGRMIIWLKKLNLNVCVVDMNMRTNIPRVFHRSGHVLNVEVTVFEE
jgi:hypothetical protein